MLDGKNHFISKDLSSVERLSSEKLIKCKSHFHSQVPALRFSKEVPRAGKNPKEILYVHKFKMIIPSYFSTYEADLWLAGRKNFHGMFFMMTGLKWKLF